MEAALRLGNPLSRPIAGSLMQINRGRHWERSRHRAGGGCVGAAPRGATAFGDCKYWKMDE
jgi:hypothetical protein